MSANTAAGSASPPTATPRRGAGLGRIATAIPLLLVVVAEGAWIAVLAGLVHEYAVRDPILGLVPIAGFVLAGAVVAAAVSGRLGTRWPPVAVGLVVVSAVVGVLLAPGARAAIATSGLDGVGPAIGENPGGLLAGMAVLRGFSHARNALHEDTVSRLLGGGLLLITFAALAGSLVADPWRSRFLGDTLTASLAFSVAAVLALALTRQRAIGLESHVDWPRNPAWVGLLVLVITMFVILALPAAALAPAAVDLALALALGPLFVIGLLAGWTRSSVRLAIIAFVLWALFVAVGPRVVTNVVPPTSPQFGANDPSGAADQNMLIVGGGLVTVLAVIGVLLLVRLWMRQIESQPTDIDEVRSIDRGDPIPRPRRRLRLPFERGPRDAVAAYRALIADLDPIVAVRRLPAETPGEHARRLRAAGHADLSLELLAADYALVRFGDIPLSRTEDRRAVGRWRRLRRRLSRIEVSPPVPASEPLSDQG